MNRAGLLDVPGVSRDMLRGEAMRVRFGEFTLDTGSRQLCRGDAERHLSPKAFELLRLLLEHRPRVLSKEELHRRLWPDTFVSEATLSSLAAEVREALGEKARSGRFVRTVHGLGYAFKDIATELESGSASAGAQPRCWIVWELGQVALKDGDHILGRDADVSVWLESPTVSRHHARIRIDGVDATIEDLDSKNGTFLRGERVTSPSPLADGDDIRLGSVLVKFRRLESGATTETQDGM